MLTLYIVRINKLNLSTMTDELFNIFFSGKILPDNDFETVKEKVGRVFKANETTLEKLFSGKAVKIKNAVNMDTAIKYRVTFRDIGAIVDIRPCSTPETAMPQEQDQQQGQGQDQAQTQASPEPEAATQAPLAGQTSADAVTTSSPVALESTLAAPGSIIDDTPPVAAAQIEAEFDLGPANQGSLEEFAENIEPAEIPDISALDIANTTGPLDDTPQPPPLDVDISGLQVDPFAGDLDDTPPPPPAEIDTSELTASAPNTGSLEEFDSRPAPVPLPDISKLKIE